jgi:hypothetical protein
MRHVLLLSLLLVFVSPGQSPSTSHQSTSLSILSFKWSRSHQVIDPGASDSAVVPPVRAVIPANKNFERNVRANNPTGARDPNEDTIDGRSAALEKNVQDSRTPQTKPVEGYAYRVKVQNQSPKVIEIVFFEYQFIDPSTPANMARRQFLCGVNIKPDKDKELQAFSISGPSDVVSVGSLGKKAVFQENVLINRVEYADGTIWQRKDWNFSDIRLTYQRAVNTPWGSEMCRSL